MPIRSLSGCKSNIDERRRRRERIPGEFRLDEYGSYGAYYSFITYLLHSHFFLMFRSTIDLRQRRNSSEPDADQEKIKLLRGRWSRTWPGHASGVIGKGDWRLPAGGFRATVGHRPGAVSRDATLPAEVLLELDLRRLGELIPVRRA